MDTLESMRIFVRIAESGSFAAAARKLHISAAAATKHVGHLEQRVGARLLNRSTRSLSLTEAGRAYYERCVELLQGIAEAEGLATAATATPAGILRMTAPVEFGNLHLAPLVPVYLARHPAAGVTLDLANRVVDLVEEEMDLAVRIAQTMDSRLVARRLASSALRVVAAPAYLDRRGRPAKPADLAEHDCLVFAYPTPWDRWPFARRREKLEVPVRPRLMSTSSETLRQSALTGAGMSLLPSFLVGTDIRAGRLVDVFPGWESATLGINVVYPSRRQLAAKVRAMIDLLFEHLGKNPEGDQWLPK